MISKYSILLNVLLPLFIGTGLLYAYNENIRPSTEIGLGEGTSSFTPFFEKYPIHIQLPSLADSMKAGWLKRGRKNITLWIGNSQLHGINQYKTGNTNCVGYLFDRLRPLDLEVAGISFPNANIQEFLVSTIYFSKLFPAKRIIMPVFFDDMREDGIRDILKNKAIIDSLKNDSSYFSQLGNITSLFKTADRLANEAHDDFSGIRETTQDISERYLNNALEDRWNLWKSRPNIRGNTFNDLYNARNALLGINASTVRKMIPGRYAENYKALLAILKYCKEHSIELIIYIPPLRNDVPVPYETNAYSSFKNNIRQLCAENKLGFLNLENLVAGQYWGYAGKSARSIDFMHFQDSAHHLIADTVFKVFVKKLI